jgi:crotonobetainyl-CoA:carnitine CoA-transferase CaiB-like acyl-CoA transferase
MHGSSGAAPGPLDGVRVIDLSAILPGPIATPIFSDQGADVIKVEPHIGEHMIRNFGAMRNGVGAMFCVVNRGKRSIALIKASDLPDPGGGL